MKKVFLSCLCFISIVSYGIELRQTDQSGIDLIFGYEYGKPDGNIFYSPKHALTFVPYTSKSEDGKRYFSIWMFRNDKIRFENIIGQISMRSVDDAEMVLQLDSSYDKRVINDSTKDKEITADAYLFHKRLAMVAASFMPGEWKTVSAQPAPSGFESDSVVCSSTNRNNGRTAWDAKDEIIGRSNCPNIGTAA